MRAFTDSRNAGRAHSSYMEIMLLIAAVILLIPVLALWIDDERDRTRAKPH